jgi:hypothetical protein
MSDKRRIAELEAENERLRAFIAESADVSSGVAFFRDLHAARTTAEAQLAAAQAAAQRIAGVCNQAHLSTYDRKCAVCEIREIALSVLPEDYTDGEATG